MRRLQSISLLLGLLLLFAGTLHAEEDTKFVFGLESRLSEPVGFSDADYSWGVIPNFSYHVTDRFRIDAFAGFSWSGSDSHYLSLQPGFRYYLTPPRGKFRFNSGLSIGFVLIDEHDSNRNAERLAELGIDAPPDYDLNEDVWLRLVPIEVEYWDAKRWGLTMALDFQERLGDTTGRLDDSGFGLAAGFRFRIR